jgi:hypothetical protein
MTTPDFRALCADLLNNLEHSAFQHCLQGEIDNDPLITRARAALAAEPVAPVGGLVERVAELREKFEQLIKCSRAYDGYSTMTPVELADRLIDAVLKLEADR